MIPDYLPTIIFPKYEMRILPRDAVDVSFLESLKDALPIIKSSSTEEGGCSILNVADGNQRTDGALNAATGNISISLANPITCKKLYLFQRNSIRDPIEKGKVVLNVQKGENHPGLSEIYYER